MIQIVTFGFETMVVTGQFVTLKDICSLIFLDKKYTVLNAKKDVTLSFLKLSDKQIPFGSFESKKMVNHWQHHTYIKEPLDADF